MCERDIRALTSVSSAVTTPTIALRSMGLAFQHPLMTFHT